MLAMVGARGFALAANRASGGVYCGADGVFVGSVPLLQRVGPIGAWSVRPVAELNDELSTHYRLPIDITAKANALSLIVHALNRGDLAMAAIASVQMQLPDAPLAKSVEAHDELVCRAAALRRSSLLKWEWDPLKHPRLGTGPNPGWFASTGGVEDSSSSVQTTSEPAVQLVADPIGGKRPFGDTSNFPTGGGGGGGTVRVFGPGGLFDGPPDYDGGPNVIRPPQEESAPPPRTAPQPAAQGAVQPELPFPSGLPKLPPQPESQSVPHEVPSRSATPEQAQPTLQFPQGLPAQRAPSRDSSSSVEGAPAETPGRGRRLGNAATRAQNAEIAAELKDQVYKITGGGGEKEEEFIPGDGPGTQGGTFVDITAVDRVTGKTLRIQTVDTLADGVTPTPREQEAAARIRKAHPNDELILITKRRMP